DAATTEGVAARIELGVIDAVAFVDARVRVGDRSDIGNRTGGRPARDVGVVRCGCLVSGSCEMRAAAASRSGVGCGGLGRAVPGALGVVGDRVALGRVVQVGAADTDRLGDGGGQVHRDAVLVVDVRPDVTAVVCAVVARRGEEGGTGRDD